MEWFYIFVQQPPLPAPSTALTLKDWMPVFAGVGSVIGSVVALLGVPWMARNAQLIATSTQQATFDTQQHIEELKQSADRTRKLADLYSHWSASCVEIIEAARSRRQAKNKVDIQADLVGKAKAAASLKTATNRCHEANSTNNILFFRIILEDGHEERRSIILDINAKLRDKEIDRAAALTAITMATDFIGHSLGLHNFTSAKPAAESDTKKTG